MKAARESVPVEVELDPALHERLRQADPDLRSCREELMAGLSRLMAELGLPAEPDLSVGAGPGAGLPVEVTVAGSPSRSARRVASRALYWAGAAGLPLSSAVDLGPRDDGRRQAPGPWQLRPSKRFAATPSSS